MLEDSLVLTNLLTPSMVVEEERFSASIITEITEVFQNGLGCYFSYGSFILVMLLVSLKHSCLENLGVFYFFFLKSLNMTCITTVATIRMIETGEGGLVDE